MANEAKEQVRAIFVLGVIGILFAADIFVPHFVLPPSNIHLTLKRVTYLLLGFWGAYLFFGVIGISDDFVTERLAKACHAFAKILFLTGIGMIFDLILLIVVGLMEAPFITRSIHYRL